MRITELLLHPIRIRIVQAAMDGTAITTSELCARMPDVSKATMYRHVALLVEGGLLKVVCEERVRGAVERSYRLEHTRAILADAEVAAMSTDDHRRGFAAAVTSLLAEFEIYLDRDGADPLTDGVSYRQYVLWLSQREKAELIEDAFDIQRSCDELAHVDLALGLEQRLVAAVVILQERLRRVLALFGSLRLRKEAHDYDSFRAKQQADNELLNSAIAPLIKPDQDQLRLAAIEAASAVRAITFSMTHHILGDHRLAEPQQIVDLVLHGICRSTSSNGAPTSC